MITLDEKIISEIKKQGEKSYPNECCGFIFGIISGENKIAKMVKSAENTSGESFHRFLITSEQMLENELFARKNALDIIGFYHSHPDCSAVPSEYDRAHALAVYSYVIVSVEKGNSKEFFSWELDKNTDYTKFSSEKINSI